MRVMVFQYARIMRKATGNGATLFPENRGKTGKIPAIPTNVLATAIEKAQRRC
jgi:hypothetical protein